MEEAAAAGAVVVEGQEEVGAVAEEAERLAEEEEHLPDARVLQHVIHGDRHA